MENSLGTLAYLFIGYICGMFFAPDIVSASLLDTNWYNVWVYAWVFGWPIMLFIHFIPLLIGAPSVVVVHPVPPVTP